VRWSLKFISDKGFIFGDVYCIDEGPGGIRLERRWVPRETLGTRWTKAGSMPSALAKIPSLRKC